MGVSKSRDDIRGVVTAKIGLDRGMAMTKGGARTGKYLLSISGH